MRIVRMVLKNWMPFGGEFDLVIPDGPIAVVAEYEDNPGRSNWAGKTAFQEAIEWAMYGIHRKTYEDDVIHNGEAGTFVRLYFDDGTDIERARMKGRSTQVTYIDADGVVHKQKAAQAAFERAVGLDNADYRATLCFAQGDTEAIVNKASGERRKLIGQWLELDAWLRVAARARVNAKEKTDEVVDIRRRLDETQDWLKAVDKEKLDQGITDAEAGLAKAVEARQAQQARLDKANAVAVARQARAELEGVQSERAALRDRLTGVSEPEGAKQAREAYDEAGAATRAAANEVTDAMQLAAGRFDGNCPVTKGECPAADVVRADRLAADRRLEKAREVQREAAERFELAKQDMYEIERQTREIDKARERYNNLTEYAKKLAQQAKAADGVEDDLIDINFVKQGLENLIEAERNAATQVTIAKRQRDEYDRQLEAEGNLGEALAAAEQEARVAALALKATGPTGIPQRIIEVSLGQLEERANGLISGIGLSFTFDMDRETRDPEPVCSECGYTYRGKRDKSCPACEAPRAAKRSDDLVIMTDDESGMVEDIKAKSGGAKALVGSAIRLSASLMLRELRGSPLAFAQVDEPFGSLDAENRATLARTFAGMLGAVGLEQAFVISHDTALLDSLPGRILITRAEGKSTIEVAS